MNETLNLTPAGQLPRGFSADAEYGVRLNLSASGSTLKDALAKAEHFGITDFFLADSSHACTGHFFQLLDGRWECLPMHGAKMDDALVAACEQSAVALDGRWECLSMNGARTFA